MIGIIGAVTGMQMKKDDHECQYVIDICAPLTHIRCMKKPLHTVALTATFLAQAKHEGITAEEIDAIADYLAENPEAGELVVGSGGCRKVRFARPGKGKSGGYRVMTVLPGPAFDLYLMAVLSKSSQGNFTDAQIAALAKIVERIKAGASPQVVRLR